MQLKDFTPGMIVVNTIGTTHIQRVEHIFPRNDAIELNCFSCGFNNGKPDPIIASYILNTSDPEFSTLRLAEPADIIMARLNDYISAEEFTKAMTCALNQNTSNKLSTSPRSPHK